ncbi:Por secretion system C-terminal sorting domain-containing protein [Mariniphaga anaerophila]|uniref:Por secretion system C-terminal sorting domain-containing protein n=1 Tax=Mariniphaga anaerophila TaxID=1484053 RepID=A0A1M4Y1E4_9BACT|nr:type IX secretion system sortase PorU [Mariniphaga anaerophila]SHE99561.1 Por secretion system C-terminal sorting domain-containing protein [Mariniphaga anaerophila]
MNKYIILLLILLTGFAPADTRREIITINWQISSQPENKLGLTFTKAGYEYPGAQVPLFFKFIPIDNPNQDFQFVIENPKFEEVTVHRLDEQFSEIPEKLEIKKTKLKSGNINKIEIQIPAIIRDGEKILLLKQFTLKQSPQGIKKSATISAFNWKTESVLKDGKWVKIATSEKGIYKIPYSKLTEYGFTNPAQVKVYGAGGMLLSEEPGTIKYDDLPQIAIWHGKNNGTDCLFFYAPGTTELKTTTSGDFLEHRINPYSTKGYFFLNEDKGQNKTIQQLPATSQPATRSISYFDEHSYYKKEQFNLISSGKQWFSERFINGTNKSFNFDLTDIDASSELQMRIKAAARSSSGSEMPVLANQSSLGKLSFSSVNTNSNTSLFASERTERFTIPAPPGNVSFTAKYFASGTSSEAWLDFIEINYRRKLKAGNNVLFFRDKKSATQDNVLEFSIEGSSADLKVWDVTDVLNVQEIQIQTSGSSATGKRQVSQLREFAAFSPNGNFPEPEFAGEVSNQNLHGLSTPEYLIIAHPAFLSQTNELADFHRSHDGMQVEVVASDKIYNEFSSGNKDATGIRNFIKMFYDRNNGLKYVLLFGDGSYDNKGIKEESQAFIPTFQSDGSLNPVSSFVTDDYFVMLDAGESVYSGAIDLGIGRIPASTSSQAQLAVKKVKDYHSESAFGDWRNVVSFIADDEDGNLHMTDSEKLAAIINKNHSEFITDKIYFDAYQQITGPGGESYPEVTEAINQRVKEGALILNYVGHANERFLSNEKVLDISHINSWSNANNLLIFVTATCEFSRFDADETSAGEYVLFNANGGGVGLFSTTRVVYAYSNFLLSESFYNFVFKKNEAGNHYRMGDVMRLAKINTVNTINKRNFSLLTDPALKLSYPRHRVYTSTINGHDAALSPDTIGALQQVTITGYVGDADGNKLSNFSGTIIPTVFDKEMVMKTRGNAGETPMSFKVQENVIYKGLAEVKNGEFSFSFLIPKDISYSLGAGKIVYYAQSEDTDAQGAFQNFVIGGSGSQITDNQGPQIELYLDSPEFTSGQKVSKNPTLLAFLSDENGINTAGAGIGHDITAVIDNDHSNAIVLNSFYKSNSGDFKSGTINYTLKNLSVGKHTLTLKAWDVANNSTEAEIEFEVTGDFTISQVKNFPNPVADHTYISFEHNQADATFDIIFEVFDLNGSHIDYLATQVGSNGTTSNPIRWDLTEAKIGLRNGIYMYRVTAQNSDGLITSKSGKLLIAR